MNEEEKKAIEKLKEYTLCKVNYNGCVEVSANGYKHTILNLIEKQQVEFEKVYEDNLTLAKELEQEKEKNKELEKHQKQYLDGELITTKQGKFFEKMIKENYIRKDKIKAIQGQLIMQLGSYVRNEASPEQERIAGGINIINEILEEK